MLRCIIEEVRVEFEPARDSSERFEWPWHNLKNS